MQPDNENNNMAPQDGSTAPEPQTPVPPMEQSDQSMGVDPSPMQAVEPVVEQPVEDTNFSPMPPVEQVTQPTEMPAQNMEDTLNAASEQMDVDSSVSPVTTNEQTSEPVPQPTQATENPLGPVVEKPGVASTVPPMSPMSAVTSEKKSSVSTKKYLVIGLAVLVVVLVVVAVFVLI